MESSTSSSLKSSLRVRKRSDTRTLLGSSYTSDIDTIPEIPKPKASLEDYSTMDFRQGLSYADFVLRNQQRKLSPLGQRALLHYKEACASLLELELGADEVSEGDELDRLTEIRREHTSIIRDWERAQQYLICLKITNSDSVDEMKETLLQMKQTLFYARYGDIFAETCKMLRTKAASMQVLGWQELQNVRWTAISKLINEERDEYNQYIGRDPLEDYTGRTDFPIHRVINTTTRAIRLDAEVTINVIHLYSNRNELLHSNLNDLIEKQLFWDLAKVLWNDLREIPKVTPPSSKGYCGLMTTVVRSLIGQWFNVPKGGEDNYQSWIAKSSLVQRSEDLITRKSIHQAEMVEGVLEHIKKAQTNNKRRGREEAIVRDMLKLDCTLASISVQKKRVASADLEEELKKVKKQKADWVKVLNVANGLRSVSENYRLDYGEIEAPLELIEDNIVD
jgi:hypothetical protein